MDGFIFSRHARSYEFIFEEAILSVIICSLIKTILSDIVFGTTQGNNQNVFIAKRLLFWRCCCFQKMSMIVIKFAKRIS